jgi:hypothetical protein
MRAWRSRSQLQAASSVSFQPPVAPVVPELANSRVREVPEGALEQLDHALGVLNGYTVDQVIPARLVLNPLLDVWGAARDVELSAGRPIERLLTSLVDRNLATAEEILAAVDEVRLAVLEAGLQHLTMDPAV